MNRHVLSAEGFQKIRNWMVRNARPLEISLWNYTFEEGSRTEDSATRWSGSGCYARMAGSMAYPPERLVHVS